MKILKVGDKVKASRLMDKKLEIPVGTEGKIIGIENTEYPYIIQFKSQSVNHFRRKEFTVSKYKPLAEVEWLDKIQENFREGV